MNQNRRNGGCDGYEDEGARPSRGLLFLSARRFPLRVVGADMVGSGAPVRGSPAAIAARRAAPRVT